MRLHTLAVAVAVAVLAALTLPVTAQLTCTAHATPAAADILFLVDGSSNTNPSALAATVSAAAALGTTFLNSSSGLRVAFAEFASSACSDKGLCTSFIASTTPSLASQLREFRLLGGSSSVYAALTYASTVAARNVRPFPTLYIVVVLAAGPSADDLSLPLIDLFSAGAAVYAVAMNTSTDAFMGFTGTLPLAGPLDQPQFMHTLFDRLLCPGACICDVCVRAHVCVCVCVCVGWRVCVCVCVCFSNVVVANTLSSLLQCCPFATTLSRPTAAAACVRPPVRRACSSTVCPRSAPALHASRAAFSSTARV
jgi:hypothetical protein